MPKLIYAFSDRLYYDCYYIRKAIISEKLYLPAVKSVVEHRFHVGYLVKHEKQKNHKTFLSEMKDFKPNITTIKKNLLKELQTYCPNPTRQSIYFFIETLKNKKKLPPYYGILYLGDYYNMWDYKQNSAETYRAFMDSYQEQLSYSIYEEKLHPSLFYDLFDCLHNLGDEINEYLDTGEIYFKTLAEFDKKIANFKELALKYFMQNVMESLFKKAEKDKQAIRCEYCNEIIDYVKGKKYCSLKSEGRDCGKKARNERFYTKNRDKILPKARKVTKELRAFYKEKGVK